MDMNLIIQVNSTLFPYQYWSVINEKCSSKLEAYTDQKVLGFHYI